MTIKEKTKKLFGYDRPFAIAMWDFSWLERRWHRRLTKTIRESELD